MSTGYENYRFETIRENPSWSLYGNLLLFWRKAFAGNVEFIVSGSERAYNFRLPVTSLPTLDLPEVVRLFYAAKMHA